MVSLGALTQQMRKSQLQISLTRQGYRDKEPPQEQIYYKALLGNDKGCAF